MQLFYGCRQAVQLFDGQVIGKLWGYFMRQVVGKLCSCFGQVVEWFYGQVIIG